MSKPRQLMRKSSSPCQTAHLLSALWSTITASMDICSPSLTQRLARCMANTPKRHETTSWDALSSVSEIINVINVSVSHCCDLLITVKSSDYEFFSILHLVYLSSQKGIHCGSASFILSTVHTHTHTHTYILYIAGRMILKLLFQVKRLHNVSVTLALYLFAVQVKKATT